MNCYTLTGEKKSPILDYADLRSLDTAKYFGDPSSVKTVAFNATIPGLSWEAVAACIMKRDVKDIFLYTCIDIVPGDSRSSVITDDCVLLVYDTFEFEAMQDDESMPLTLNGTTVYRLSYSGKTKIKHIKSGDVYINVDGKIVKETKNDEIPETQHSGKYGVELSF